MKTALGPGVLVAMEKVEKAIGRKPTSIIMSPIDIDEHQNKRHLHVINGPANSAGKYFGMTIQKDDSMEPGQCEICEWETIDEAFQETLEGIPRSILNRPVLVCKRAFADGMAFQARRTNCVISDLLPFAQMHLAEGVLENTVVDHACRRIVEMVGEGK